MLRFITKMFFITLLMCGVGACTSENARLGTMSAGLLSVTIDADDTVGMAGSEGSVIATGYEPATGSVSLTMTSHDGEYSHRWEDASQFQQGQFYIAGLYMLQAGSGNPLHEGFDRPAFSGKVDVQVDEGLHTDAVLKLSLANALVRVAYTETLLSEFESVTASLHTPGGLYHAYPSDETRMLCLNPGLTEIILDITFTDGRSVTFAAYTGLDTREATLYDITVDCDATPLGPEITVETPAGSHSTLMSERFINAEAPLMRQSWTEGEVLYLPEGNTPSQPYSIEIESATPLSALMLSVLSRSLYEQGMPYETDLLHLTPAQADELRDLGLTYSLTATGGVIRFDGLLGNLVYLDEMSAMSSFSVMATSSDGRSSQPVSLFVRTSPVDIEVVKTYPVTMCIDIAHIEVRCDESGFMGHVEIETLSADGDWTKIEPLAIEPLEGGLYSLSFGVSEGSEPVSARILYCDEIRSTFTLYRTMPPFSIEVDPFATMAAVRIVSPDESLLETITSKARIYINGSEAPIYHSVPDSGILSVIGLAPSTAYEFKATLMSGVDNPEFSQAVTVVTEGTPQLPNADFEDRAEGAKYKNLPSGGRYSQTVVEIFNWQHFTTFDQEVPKQWANTNAKTFAMLSDNHNTWYMQPSVALTRRNVFSQSFAVELTSVAFDPHGKPIPDYTQTGTPYLDYSPIVPDISYRAAGKLFLGRYTFDPATVQESYVEGLEWNSRPASLNGYYCYYPVETDRSDCGLVTVEVLGVGEDGETVIASGSQRLTLAMSYTAFSVPLNYEKFGVKATRIKVMFSSSAHVGTIEEESARIRTVSNPVSATSVGGKLWIDNITLAY